MSGTPEAGGTPRNTPVDLQAAARLVEQLEHDLAAARAGSANLDRLRSEVDQLRALLAQPAPSSAEVHASLSGVRSWLHAFSDELFTDAVKSGDYLARLGRILGM